jgi:hypothetical protein
MLELFALVCGIAVPCKEINFQFSSDTRDNGITELQCGMGGAGVQRQIAKWLEEHPGYEYGKRYGCHRTGQFAKA